MPPVPSVNLSHVAEGLTRLTDMFKRPPAPDDWLSRDAKNDHEYFGKALTVSAPWAERDGSRIEFFLGKYWLLGGWDPIAPEWGGSDVTTNEVWSSPDLITWTKELAHDSNPPTSGAGARWRYRHTFMSFVHNGFMWVVGGDTSDSPVPSDVWKTSDGVTWTRVAATSPWGPAYLAIPGYYQGYMHVMGGTNTPRQHWRSVDGVSWERLPDMPFGRMSVYQAVVTSGRMYVIGGLDEDLSTQKNETWAYNGEEWHRMSASATFPGREWICNAAYDSKLWSLTGKQGVGNGGGLRYSEDVGVTWTELSSYPYGPSHADSIMVLPGVGIILAAGNGNPGSVFVVRAMPKDPSVTMQSVSWSLWFDGANYNAVNASVSGKTSAGTSGAKALTATGAPVFGEISGRPTIILDGVNDALRYGLGAEAGDIISTTAWTIAFTGKINASSNDSGSPYLNPGLGGDSGAWFNTGVRSSGVIEAYQDGGGTPHADTSWTPGALVHVQIRYNGSQLQIRKGKGVWTSVAASAIGGTLGTFNLGANYNLSKFLGVEICEYAAARASLSDVILDLIADDMHAKWGVVV